MAKATKRPFYGSSFRFCKESDDESIFAWTRDSTPSGLLAQSRADFALSYNAIALRNTERGSAPNKQAQTAWSGKAWYQAGALEGLVAWPRDYLKARYSVH
jgi:hypothetical protein